MKNEVVKTFMGIPCVIVMGCLDIAETVFEMIYQLVRLFRRGFKLFANAVFKSIEPLYKNNMDYGIKKANVNNDESCDYEIFEID